MWLYIEVLYPHRLILTFLVLHVIFMPPRVITIARKVTIITIRLVFFLSYLYVDITFTWFHAKPWWCCVIFPACYYPCYSLSQLPFKLFSWWFDFYYVKPHTYCDLSNVPFYIPFFVYHFFQDSMDVPYLAYSIISLYAMFVKLPPCTTFCFRYFNYFVCVSVSFTCLIWGQIVPVPEQCYARSFSYHSRIMWQYNSV